MVGNFGAGAPAGIPVGGGVGYPDIILEGSATDVCDTKSELMSACTSTTSGDIIFVPNGTTIDLTGESQLTINAGVTVASDRGNASHSGGIIKKTTYTADDWTGRMFDVGGTAVRVTGIILEGQMLPDSEEPLISEGNYTRGILNYNGYTNLVVDNCELRGWSYAAVQTHICPTVGRPVVKYNWIHDNIARGEGYGMEVWGGDALFEYNLCDYNRHSITGTGMSGEKYECCYNVFLGNGSPIGGFHVDVHESIDGEGESYNYSGEEYHTHHNTVYDIGGLSIDQMGFVHVTCDPVVGHYINDNIIETNWGGIWQNANDGLTIANYGGQHGVINQTQYRGSSQVRVYCTDNKWRGTDYEDNTGILWYDVAV
jgi:hypothetical protein